MAFILASWAMLAVACTGLGLLLHAAMGLRDPSGTRLALAAPAGFCVALLLLQLWHFLLPINGLALAAVALVALAGWALELRHAAAWAGLFRRRGVAGLLAAALLALAAVWLANRALGPGQAFDSGLYHWNTILWHNAHPAVPGLANLHHRLGFNSSSLLFAALLNTGPWHRSAGHLANGFMLLLLFLVVIQGLIALRAVRPEPAHLAAAALLAPALAAAMGFDLAAPSTDLPVGVIALLSGVALAGALLAPPGDPLRVLHLAHVPILLAAAACLKLSALPLALAAAPIWLALAFSNAPPPASTPAGHRPARRAAVIPAAFAAALLLSWAARGIVLSGHPFFPSTALSPPVPWRFPHAAAAHVQSLTMQFARHHNLVPGQEFNQWDWVGPLLDALPWAPTLYNLQTAPLLLALAWALARPGCRAVALRALWLLLPPTAGLAAWFLAAPDPRLGWHLFWLVPIGPIAALALTPRPRLLAVAWMVPLLIAALMAHDDWGPRFWHHVGPHTLLNPIPQPQGVRTVRLPPGVEIMVANDGLIWDHPLPSTSLIEPGATARDPANLARGFYAATNAPGRDTPP